MTRGSDIPPVDYYEWLDPEVGRVERLKLAASAGASGLPAWRVSDILEAVSGVRKLRLVPTDKLNELRAIFWKS